MLTYISVPWLQHFWHLAPNDFLFWGTVLYIMTLAAALASTHNSILPPLVTTKTVSRHWLPKLPWGAKLFPAKSHRCTPSGCNERTAIYNDWSLTSESMKSIDLKINQLRFALLKVWWRWHKWPFNRVWSTVRPYCHMTKDNTCHDREKDPWSLSRTYTS